VTEYAGRSEDCSRRVTHELAVAAISAFSTATRQHELHEYHAGQRVVSVGRDLDEPHGSVQLCRLFQPGEAVQPHSFVTDTPSVLDDGFSQSATPTPKRTVPIDQHNRVPSPDCATRPLAKPLVGPWSRAAFSSRASRIWINDSRNFPDFDSSLLVDHCQAMAVRGEGWPNAGSGRHWKGQERAACRRFVDSDQAG
jgi:hypothetical protein